MSLNKFMHPRNIYKNPPDFKVLAKEYPEFSEICKTEVTGNVTIDFKDPVALRTLTKCLLNKDFGLKVEIPEDRLVPTLPLRLNYILWLEDMLIAIKETENVWGIDIGTGACAIYPLLAAVTNKWHMIGTESDKDSYHMAVKNIETNKSVIADLIKLIYNPTKSVVEHVFTQNSDQKYDFCMCNPPFYSNVQELCESRSMARPPPKNAFTGSPQELITEGGELEFIKCLIAESKKLPDKICIYSTMVGHKYNLKELLEELRSLGVKHTHTEFCQGRVTRWGLAWTFQDVDLSIMAPPRDKTRKKNKPSTYQLPTSNDTSYDVDAIIKKLQNILRSLNINYKFIIKRGNSTEMDILAKANTWCNQRKKRRMLKMLNETSKKPKLDINSASSSVEETSTDAPSTSNPTENTSPECTNSPVEEQDVIKTHCDSSHTKEHYNKSSEDKNSCIEKHENGQPPCENTNEENDSVVVYARFKVYKVDNKFMLETLFKAGSAGKEGLHQIVQYVKNNWK